MSTDVAVVQYASASMEDRKNYAATIAKADDLLPKGLRGIIKDANGNNVQGIVPGKVLLILETGAMLGINPMAALQEIKVIDGAASIAPALMQALARRAGHKLHVDVTGTVEGGDIAATAKLTRADEPEEPYIVTWTVWDAVAADLVQKYEKDEKTGKWVVTARSEKGNKLNWEKYTRQMLKWRAQSEVMRDGGEDVLMGVHYSPEELGAVVTEDGDVVEAETIEPTEDWENLIQSLTTSDEISDVVGRAKAAGEYTDAVRTVALTRIGMISRGEVKPDGEYCDPVKVAATDPGPGPDEMTDEDYERMSREEFARAMASREASE